jgi:DNA-binding cell septation regulator SpoVG
MLAERKGAQGAQMIAAEDVTIEVRLLKKSDSNLKAYADVTLSLGDSGVIVISGFLVIGSGPFIAPPSRKGGQSFFPVVQLTGKVKTLV